MTRDEALKIARRIMDRIEQDRAIHLDAMADEIVAGMAVAGPTEWRIDPKKFAEVYGISDCMMGTAKPAPSGIVGLPLHARDNPDGYAHFKAFGRWSQQQMHDAGYYYDLDSLTYLPRAGIRPAKAEEASADPLPVGHLMTIQAGCLYPPGWERVSINADGTETLRKVR